MGSDNPGKARAQAAAWRLQALALKLFWGVSARMPPVRASAFGRRVMRFTGPVTSKHGDVLANLRTAFPEKPDAEIRELGRDMWASLGATLAEYPHLKTLGEAPDLEIVNFTGVEDLQAGGPFIFVSAHLANWELMAFTIRALSGPTCMIYNPQKNPYLEAMVQARRAVITDHYVPVQNALHGLYRSLRRGHSVALLVDYRVKGGDLIPFFGVPATTTTAPAWLAARTGCGVLPVGAERLGDARYRITLRPLMHMKPCGKPSREDIEAFTAEINKEIENLIRVAPGQWLCTKKRWPRKLLR